MIRGIILDLDGVICDTAGFHYLAWKRLASDYGYTLTEEDNESLKGVSRIDSLKFICGKAKTELSEADFQIDLQRKNEWYLEYVKQMDESHLLPGVTKFFRIAKYKGIPLALGSASRNAALVLSKVGLLSAFDAIVDANQVVNGKPHPETFNKAADMLNMAPHECIVFEDSVSGIQAAKTAEMYSIGVGNPSDLEWADEFVTSLGEYDFHHFG